MRKRVKLHTHPHLEKTLKVDPKHVIIDKEAYLEMCRIFTPPTKNLDHAYIVGVDLATEGGKDYSAIVKVTRDHYGNLIYENISPKPKNSFRILPVPPADKESPCYPNLWEGLKFRVKSLSSKIHATSK